MSSFVLGLALGAAAVALFVLARASVRIENGSLGVISSFGRFVRDAAGAVKTLGPGLHWKAPWTDVAHVSLAERSVAVDGSGSAAARGHAPTGEHPRAAIEVLASDGTRIRVHARLRFRVDPDRVATFLADSKHAIAHLCGLFQLTLREQLARFEQRPDELSAYTALRLRMNELQHRTLEGMKHPALAEYGIVVIAVDLLQIDPPEELVDALNAVITAESEAHALVARTELLSQQRVISAEQAVEIAHARALAVESEIRTVGEELSVLSDQGVLRDYVARRRAEVMGGSRRVYLNHPPSLRS
ncbi:MAG: SPFH domain-containing protein [Myxococcales bacterium]|nr:SPFH domain-containing protein [Myxococcales bacterium]